MCNSPRTESNRVVRYRRTPRVYHLSAAETNYQDRLTFVRRLWWLNTFRIAPEHIGHRVVPEEFAERYLWNPAEEWIYHPTCWEQAIINNEPAPVVSVLLQHSRDQLSHDIQLTEVTHWVKLLQHLQTDFVENLPDQSIRYLLNQPQYRDCSQDR
jgi:hypothetical protein